MPRHSSWAGISIFYSRLAAATFLLCSAALLPAFELAIFELETGGHGLGIGKGSVFVEHQGDFLPRASRDVSSN